MARGNTATRPLARLLGLMDLAMDTFVARAVYLNRTCNRWDRRGADQPYAGNGSQWGDGVSYGDGDSGIKFVSGQFGPVLLHNMQQDRPKLSRDKLYSY